jgi:hypothetical protein
MSLTVMTLAPFAGGVRILSVGNRPQLLASAPLSLALRERGVDEVVVQPAPDHGPEFDLPPRPTSWSRARARTARRPATCSRRSRPRF